MKCILKMRYIKNTFSSISNPLLQNKSTFAPMILSYPVITTFQSNCKCHLSVQERASFVRSISLINLRFESCYNNNHSLNKMCFFLSHFFSLTTPYLCTYCCHLLTPHPPDCTLQSTLAGVRIRPLWEAWPMLTAWGGPRAQADQEALQLRVSWPSQDLWPTWVAVGNFPPKKCLSVP